MKILILGARGMLGHDLAEEFKQYNPILWDREELDITDLKKTLKLISEVKPDIIINAAAYTDVEGAEDNETTANLINAKAVDNIAKVTKQVKAKFIHISTEYVFSGLNKLGYSEDDRPEPLSAYGRSKFKGEVKLIESGCSFYLVRTSWLYGKAPQMGKPRGKNFIDTIIAKAQDGQTLKVVNDQFGKPTFTKDLAQGIHDLIKSKKPTGIYHIVNDGVTTWYGLAQKALQLKGIDVKINPCDSSEYPSKAERPQYSVLQNTKLQPLRNWQEALSEYLKL